MPKKKEFFSVIDPEVHRGDGIADFNLMFSGKTFRVGQQIAAIEDMNQHRSPKMQILYVVINSSADTSVENGVTFSRRGGTIPAITILRNKPEMALEEVRKLDKESGFVDVIFFDEVHFLPLSIIGVISQFQQDRRIQWVAGLSEDFRGEPYFVTQQIAKLFKYHIAQRPMCTIQDSEGEQCGNLAAQTIRMVKVSQTVDGVSYPNARSFNFYKHEKSGDKRVTLVMEGYLPAPYWHKTELPRGTPGIEYTVACMSHLEMAQARKTEALSVIEHIKRKKAVGEADIKRIFANYEDLENILKFAVEERGIVYNPETELYSFRRAA